MQLRIGFGEDAHQLAAGRPLVIGGVRIENSPLGAVAHSDGDVLLHALSDALLSAFALGDIGHYFPPSQLEFKDLDSQVIVQHVLKLLQAENAKVHNLAAVITLDSPKLGTYRHTIQMQLASLLGIAECDVGLGFKTSEGLASGHIQARVTVLLSVSPG